MTTLEILKYGNLGEWDPESRICLACHYRLDKELFFDQAGKGYKYFCKLCYEDGKVTPELDNFARRLHKTEWQQRKRRQQRMAELAQLRLTRANASPTL